MPDYSNHGEVLALLKEAQDAEYGLREKCSESHRFIYEDGGQWEAGVANSMTNRPKYTFDLVTPIIDQIAGSIEQASFGIRVKPIEDSDDKKRLVEDIIRGIEVRSDSANIYSRAARNMIISGIAGWRVESDWIDDSSFHQDLIVRPISNFYKRVWFDPNSEMQDSSDAEYCFVLQSMTRKRAESEFEGFVSGLSGSVDDYSSCNNAEKIMIGEVIYKKREKVELVLMSDGSVYEDDDNFKTVVDELALQGVFEARRRKTDKVKVCTRLFSSDRFLSEEKDTPFKDLPVIPTYADFNVIDGGNYYRGLTSRLMDAQRVYNYAKSREIEEGALAPRRKIVMTHKQAAGQERKLATLNTNMDPVLLWNHDDNAPPPFEIGGASINPGLARVSDDAALTINKSAGLFSSNMGDNPGLQSGVAIELQQQKGDNGTSKYFKSQEIAIRQTARVLLGAIPSVYDTKRILTVVGEDGQERTETVNDVIIDNQTGVPVEVNNMARGKYDVDVKSGTSYKGRQQETVKAITEIAAVDPTVLQVGADVLLSNISAPGVDTLAKRVRHSMVVGGAIPEDQLTEEEMKLVAAIQQQQAQSQEVDPAQAIAQAELEKAKAETADTISRIREREAKQEANDIEMLLKQQQQQFENIIAASKADIAELKAEAEVMKTIREAMGSKVNMVTPESVEAFSNQAAAVLDTQDDIIESEVNRLLRPDNS